MSMGNFFKNLIDKKRLAYMLTPQLKRKLKRKEEQIIQICSKKIQKLKLRKIMRAMRIYTKQQQMWMRQIRDGFRLRQLQLRLQDILNYAQCQIFLRARNHKTIRSIFLVLKKSRQQSEMIEKGVDDIVCQKMLEKSFYKLKAYYKIQSKHAAIERKIKRKRLQLLKLNIIKSMRVFTQRMQRVKKDPILQRFKDNSYFDEQGDLVIVDEGNDNAQFFGVKTIYQEKIDYIGNKQSGLKLRRNSVTHVELF